MTLVSVKNDEYDDKVLCKKLTDTKALQLIYSSEDVSEECAFTSL